MPTKGCFISLLLLLLLLSLRFILASTCLFFSSGLLVVGLHVGNSDSNMSPSSKRLVHGSDDVLFGSIEHQQQGRPFGDVLDAGTGLHSLRWIATLPLQGMESFCAITADEMMRRNVQQEAEALGVAHMGTVLVGNWFDNEDNPLSLQGRKFDTILADYLIGAMDGFSPYQQDRMLHILASYLKPGGRLYIVGLEPIPDKAPDGENNAGANVICRVRQVRDACILLAGHRCYREYPMEWVERQVEAQHPDLVAIDSRKFPILYRHVTIQRQIQVGRSKLKWFPTQSLVDSMTQVLDDLEQASLDATTKAPNGKIAFGFDYIVTVEKKVGDDCNNGIESGARPYHRADTAETG